MLLVGSTLFIRARGVFSVSRDGADCTPHSRKGQAVIAYLASHPDVPISRDRMVALLWSDRGEQQGRASLRQCLHVLHGLGDPDPLISADAHHLCIARDRVVWDYEALCGELAAGDSASLLRWLDADAPWFEGLDGLDEAFDEWLRHERMRRDDSLRQMVVQSAEAAMERGDFGLTSELCTRFADIDPASEQAAALGIRADAALGNRDGVRRRLAVLRAGLADEAGVEPSAEIVALARDCATNNADRVETPGLAAVMAPDLPAPLLIAPVEPSDRPARWRAALRPTAMAGLVAVLAALVMVLLWSDGRGQAAGTAPVVAVVPFKGLVPADEPMAEAIWDDTRRALSRNPQLLVLGRATMESAAARKLDPRDYRKRLDADFLVDGTVQRAGGEVRVAIGLVRTRDGVEIWTRRFTASADHAFHLQDTIATRIEGQLRSRFAGDKANRAEALATDARAYGAYRSARSLLNRRGAANSRAARLLLEEALQADPGFAPAWALLSIAEALSVAQGDSQDPARRQRARAHALKAIDLAPRLAEGHAALAFARGFDDPRAAASIERAVALDPGNAEAWMWLGNARNAQGRRQDAIKAYRRSVAIEPFWTPANLNLASTLFESGDAPGALAVAARLRGAGQAGLADLVEADIALSRGQIARSVRLCLPMARAPRDSRLRGYALSCAATALLALGEEAAAVRLSGRSPETLLGPDPQRLPGPQALARRFADPMHFWRDGEGSVRWARALAKAGRGDELLALYDRAFDTPAAFAAGLVPMVKVPAAVLLAPVLRARGRPAEASALLALAERALDADSRRGHPRSANERVLLAQLRAARGDRAGAIRYVEQAVAVGWVGEPLDARFSLVRDPGLAPLVGDPALQALQQRIDAHRARERAALASLKL